MLSQSCTNLCAITSGLCCLHTNIYVSKLIKKNHREVATNAQSKLRKFVLNYFRSFDACIQTIGPWMNTEAVTDPEGVQGGGRLNPLPSPPVLNII